MKKIPKTKIHIIIITVLISCTFLFTGCSKEYSGIDYTGIEINTDTSEDAILNLTTFFYPDF